MKDRAGQVHSLEKKKKKQGKQGFCLFVFKSGKMLAILDILLCPKEPAI